MANEENLKKGKATQFQSGEEAARNGHKGGVSSGASRRRRKAMKQTVNTLLGSGLNAGAGEFLELIKPRLLVLGIDAEDATYQDILLAGIMLKAMKGDVRAAEFIRDIAGDSPYLELKKQELKLRKEELRLKRELEARRTEGAKATAVEAVPRQIDLSKVTDEELEALDEITGKLFAE